MKTLSMVVLAAACAAAGQLHAQQSTRSGFFLSIGAGTGSAGVECPDCGPAFDAERLSGVSGYLRFGGTVSPSFQLGVEGGGWIRNGEGLERRIATASLVMIAYPGGGPFFIRGGAGGLRAVIESAADVIVGTGLVASGGVGLDIPMGTGVALTPFATYYYSTAVAPKLNGIALGTDLNPNILQAGIGITIP